MQIRKVSLPSVGVTSILFFAAALKNEFAPLSLVRYTFLFSLYTAYTFAVPVEVKVNSASVRFSDISFFAAKLLRSELLFAICAYIGTTSFSTPSTFA